MINKVGTTKKITEIFIDDYLDKASMFATLGNSDNLWFYANGKICVFDRIFRSARLKPYNLMGKLSSFEAWIAACSTDFSFLSWYYEWVLFTCLPYLDFLIQLPTPKSKYYWNNCNNYLINENESSVCFEKNDEVWIKLSWKIISFSSHQFRM